MHIQRDTTQITVPETESGTSLARQAVRRLRIARPTPSRFAATVSAAQGTRTERTAFDTRARPEGERLLTRQLANALEAAMAVGWPDETEPRNEEWRRLIWLARRG